MAAAINYLYDVTFTIESGGADDGVFTSGGSAVSFKADVVRIRTNRTTEDHSAGQDPVEWQRTRKISQSLDISKKLEIDDAIGALIAANAVVKFAATGEVGGMLINGTGIVGEIEGEFGAPSNLNFSIHSYGALWTTTA
jgi:hypothetical protein